MRQKRLEVIENIELKEAKTRHMVDFLKPYELNCKHANLLIVSDWNEDIFLASRNIRNLYVMDSTLINPVSLIRAKKILIEEQAIKAIEKGLSL